MEASLHGTNRFPNQQSSSRDVTHSNFAKNPGLPAPSLVFGVPGEKKTQEIFKSGKRSDTIREVRTLGGEPFRSIAPHIKKRGKLFACRSVEGNTTCVSGSRTRLSEFLHALIIIFLILAVPVAHGYGAGMSTLAASFSSDGPTVCGIKQGSTQSIHCWRRDKGVYDVVPNVSFLGISGGEDTICGIRQSTLRPFCWQPSNSSRIRRMENTSFSQLVVGQSHVCGLLSTSSQSTGGGLVHCWRNKTVHGKTPAVQTFTVVAAGGNFSCGLAAPNHTVECWGDYNSGALPISTIFSAIQAGGQHACGMKESGVTECWGNNTYGQRSVPEAEFVALALGERHSCGVLASNHTILCWGDNRSNQTAAPVALTFSAIAAGDLFTCGLVESNFLVYCWGGPFNTGRYLPLNLSIPSPCTTTNCTGTSYGLLTSNVSGESQNICASSQHVCLPCRTKCDNGLYEASGCGSTSDIVCKPAPTPPTASPFLPPTPSNAPASPKTVRRSRISGGVVALVVFGSVGTLIGVLSIAWCVWAKFFVSMGPSWRCTCTCDGGQGRVHNSAHHSTGPVDSTAVARRIRRQRSSTSSNTRRSQSDLAVGRAQEFTFSELALATNNFTEENKIGAGGFGSVYKGELPDGREVAIKRGDKEARASARKIEEKESAFLSELEFLSRLHHKHLVSLVGYCDEEDERMLVYEYMPNGSLHDHLHKKEIVAPLSWHMRIKIALEAARGIEYLHTYALPPIIHRDIKSSNILLDASWAARVSDFGLSLMGPEEENSHLSLTAAGTVGYMDPEYYRLQHLTPKSDVYSFGVVLLEILTGQRAIHKQITGPINVVDFAVPEILADRVFNILDPRAEKPQPIEIEAISVLAEVAELCVRLEGKERPIMSEIVNRLEHAMALSRANQRMQARNNQGTTVAEV